MNPQAPAAASSFIEVISSPLSPQETAAAWKIWMSSKASRSISSLRTGTESMTGEVFAIQITEVNPPAAAARDPV